MANEFFLGYYVAYCGLKKRADAGAPVTALFDPQSGKRREGLIRFDGLPEYSQLSAGLEVGAIYSWEESYDFDVTCAENGYLSFLVKLAEMVGHDQEMTTPNTPPPFFELLRYGLRGVLSGLKSPESCKRISMTGMSVRVAMPTMRSITNTVMLRHLSQWPLKALSVSVEKRNSFHTSSAILGKEPVRINWETTTSKKPVRINGATTTSENGW
ncbi:hypothetical protein NOV72_01994 [Caballeronia novacaledonica]|uniref:Uncharacterized protein n=1 Tax=Caballeronia novacaledonica TaxID=1544861 RepID=A0A2U3I3N7_9BURK|nr:hypothetical protein [Caballeronia novacaledonica]SPB14762.1 hypothetical protein NOV72_01994 [Caballeronia novacaledonica]